jgi:hypothetical protein
MALVAQFLMKFENWPLWLQLLGRGDSSLGVETVTRSRILLGGGFVHLPMPILHGFRAQMSRPERSPAFWVIVGVLVLLNIWFDYYHPLGIVFDVVLAVFLLIWFSSPH